MTTITRTALNGLRAATAVTAAIAALAAFTAHSAYATQPGDDPNKGARWEDFKQGMFQDRPVDPHGDGVIRLDAPAHPAAAPGERIALPAQVAQPHARKPRTLQ